jgi:AraC-like DNA-binding protein
MQHCAHGTECGFRVPMGRNVRTEASRIERLRSVGHGEVAVPPELQAALPAFFHSAGFQTATHARTVWSGLRRAGTELATIHHTLSGRSRLRFDGRELLVGPGQTMLLCAPHDHTCWVEAGESWEFFYVTIGGHAAVRGMREAVGRLGPLFEVGESSPLLPRMAEACTQALEGNLGSPYLASEMAYGIVMALLGDGSAQPAAAPPKTPRRPSFVFAVEQFCRENLTRPIGVDDMARVAKMSRFHFTRMFEKACGTSPGRYLASLRLEESLRLIARGNHSVKAVAEECGYGDANYFCKVFRKSFGISPGAFRAGIAQNRPRFSPGDHAPTLLAAAGPMGGRAG